MIAITDLLVAEHRVFRDLFDYIESVLPRLNSVEEARLLICLVERLLKSHADAEEELAYVALDHVLRENGCLDELNQDHHEIDASLERAREARDLASAQRFLKMAIVASRAHFHREELSVFPNLEDALQPDTLAALGAARLQSFPRSPMG
jgi:hemerythrin-like domain-containing protein